MTTAARQIKIDAGRGAELSIANQDFTLHESRLGAIDRKLPPDLYTLTVRVAGHTAEYDLVINAGDDVRIVPDDGVVIKKTTGGVQIDVAQPAFASAAPLRETSRSHEYQGDFVEHISNHPVNLLQAKGGPTGEVLLSARAWKRSSKDPSDLGLSVALMNSDGAIVTDLVKDGTHEATGDPIVARSVRLRPGWFRLRIARRDRPVVEQSLVVCAGWQTQVFFLREQVPRDRMRVSVMMQATDQRHFGKTLFQPRSTGADRVAGPRMTELALIGLARGRSVVSAEQLDEMLHQKFTDPMLGIYGAHLLIDKPDLLRVVVTNLRRLLHGTKHPDVEALALRVPKLAESATIEYPPMLTASWRNIVSRSAKHPGVVPRGSINASVARRLNGTGVWLWWTSSSDPIRAAPPTRRSVKSRAALATILRRPPPLRAARTAEHAALLRMIPREGVHSDHATLAVQSIVEAMAMPRVVIEDLAAELLGQPGSGRKTSPALVEIAAVEVPRSRPASPVLELLGGAADRVFDDQPRARGAEPNRSTRSPITRRRT
jgi:hypothetical protein